MNLTIFRIVTLRVQGEKKPRKAKPHTWVALVAAPNMAAIIKYLEDDLTNDWLHVESITDCGPLLHITDADGKVRSLDSQNSPDQ